jgi:hypothetical protein
MYYSNINIIMFLKITTMSILIILKNIIWKMMEKLVQLKILKTLLHLSWKIVENDQKPTRQWNGIRD